MYVPGVSKQQCLSIKSLADTFSCGLISQVFKKNRPKFMKYKFRLRFVES